jgi:hypothetical protein
LISQRWDEEFAEKVRNTAKSLNMTTTDLTVESLEIIISLINNNPDIMQEPESWMEYFKKITKGEIGVIQAGEPSKKKHSGYIKDRLVNFLQKNAGQTFSSTELSRVLEIPQPTVRTYIRDLADNNPKYRLISGRPNFIGYFD